MEALVLTVISIVGKCYVPVKYNQAHLSTLIAEHHKAMGPKNWLARARAYSSINWNLALKCTDQNGNIGTFNVKPDVVGLSDKIACNTGTSMFGDLILHMGTVGLEWTLNMSGIYAPDTRTFHATKGDQTESGGWKYWKWIDQPNFSINWEVAKKDQQKPKDKYSWFPNITADNMPTGEGVENPLIEGYKGTLTEFYIEKTENLAGNRTGKDNKVANRGV